MAVMAVPDVSWFSIIASFALLAAVVAYSEVQGKWRQRIYLGVVVALVLASLATTVTHAQYYEWKCDYESWWILLMPECW